MRFPNVQCVLGDITRDLPRLIALCSGIDTVIHSAAVKFIPEAEHSVLETIDVNIEGSRNVAMAAIAAGVKTVVGISTDKACAPLNLYGMTKAVMERMYSEFSRLAKGRVTFVTVRYGNVVGSTGSVIPIFIRQVKERGEIQVTDEAMTRFWLSPDQAVDQILWAADSAIEHPGYTFIHPCPAMRIIDLASAVWKLQRPMQDFAPRIKIVGIRPGEKLHESLFNAQEAPRVQILERGHVLMPATNVGGVPPEAYIDGYSSDVPVSWVSQQDMISYIREAASI